MAKRDSRVSSERTRRIKTPLMTERETKAYFLARETVRRARQLSTWFSRAASEGQVARR